MHQTGAFNSVNAELTAVGKTTKNTYPYDFNELYKPGMAYA
jgi:hypothetical protein